MKHIKLRGGKRAKANKNSKRNFIIAFIAILLIAVSIFFYILFCNKTDLQEPTDLVYDEQNTIEEPATQDQPVVDLNNLGVEFVDASDIPSSANGFSVLGQIVIDKIGIKCYIYDTNSKSDREKALKFRHRQILWPSALMTLGNLCIEGHNYKKVFTYLSNLAIGDSFYIISKDGRKVTYQITEMIRGVDPHDMSHIEQNSDNIRKVTLITCDPRRTHEIFGKSRTKYRK